jgi:FkbM family methyltransferase
MIPTSIKDLLLERFAFARRMYGAKLMLTHGTSDVSKWFLSNGEKLKFTLDLEMNGLVLDIGAFKGTFTKKLMRNNPNNRYWLFEPIPKYFLSCKKQFEKMDNVSIHPLAVTSDGRSVNLSIRGLRSRVEENETPYLNTFSSVSITDVFKSTHKVELLKLNIEGMEYEVLNELIAKNNLIKARYLLIQFHNFNVGDEKRYIEIQKSLQKDYENCFSFKWVWELWERKGSKFSDSSFQQSFDAFPNNSK